MADGEVCVYSNWRFMNYEDNVNVQTFKCSNFKHLNYYRGNAVAMPWQCRGNAAAMPDTAGNAVIAVDNTAVIRLYYGPAPNGLQKPQ